MYDPLKCNETTSHRLKAQRVLNENARVRRQRFRQCRRPRFKFTASPDEDMRCAAFPSELSNGYAEFLFAMWEKG